MEAPTASRYREAHDPAVFVADGLDVAERVDEDAFEIPVYKELRLLALLVCCAVVGLLALKATAHRWGFSEQRFDVVELAAGPEPLQPPREVSPPADRSLVGRAGQVSEPNQRGDSTHDPCDV